MPRLALVSILAVLFSMAAPVPAQASEGSEPAAGSILVIMDVSGSMQRKDATGTTLIQGARKAVHNLVTSAPPQTPVGLRLYGNTYAGNNKAKGCKDTRLSVPIGPLSSTGTQIDKVIDAAKPTGFTPIGYSLKQAAGDFGPEGERTIVLVSDGEDTCNTPPPCTAAKQLKSRGIGVRIDTVGLFLQDNAKARKQLGCIAKATGGDYYAADDADALTNKLSTVSQRAVRRFQTAGTPVVGGPAATQATEIETGKAYTDDIAMGEGKWYSFEGQAGQDVKVTVTEDGSNKYGCCMSVNLDDPDLSRIAHENGFNSSGAAKTYLVKSYDDGLQDSGKHYVQVLLEHSSPGPKKAIVNTEIKVDATGGTTTPSTSASPTPSPSASASTAPAPKQAKTDSGGSGGNGLLLAVIGLLCLLVLGLGVAVALLFARTRKQGPPTPVTGQPGADPGADPGNDPNHLS